MQLFSQRNRKAPDTYIYKIDQRVRNRLMYVLEHCTGDVHHLADEVADMLLLKFGSLRKRNGQHPINRREAIIEHLLACSDEEVMDFLQLCFQTRYGGGGQDTVDALNEVLEDENIGFEVTDWVREELGDGSFREHPPSIRKKSEKLLHRETVQPCFHALSHKQFASANAELQNAFDEYRQGKYADAITDAGSAVESVLKTICKSKRWSYDPNATCAKLLDVCRDKGLFHGFYKPILEGTGTIRNKVGDAHGKGPAPEYAATKELADHMIYTACTNINLLISLAKL